MINIILLNWNSLSDVLKSFEYGISRQTHVGFRLILVDNFSCCDERRALEDWYKGYQGGLDIHLVINTANFGYAGGNNKGFEYCRTNGLEGDILILNPDVTMSENTLHAMSEALVGNVGVVMCRTRNKSCSVEYDALKLDGFRQWYKILSENGVYETDYAAGCCILIRRDLVEKIGLFDEMFFMYWEEVDLSYRVRKFGYLVATTTCTSIYREPNTPARNVNAVHYYIRNSFLLRRKHPDYFSLCSHVKFLSISFLSQVVWSLLRREPIRILKYFGGLLSGLKGSYARRGL